MFGVGGQTISVGQCVPVSGGYGRTVETSVRVSHAVALAFDLRIWCSFSDQPDCAALGTQEILATVQILPSPMPDWDNVSAETTSPSTAASALCGIEAIGNTGADIAFYLDDLRTQGPIFADGFESGDTSAWSRTVP